VKKNKIKRNDIISGVLLNLTMTTLLIFFIVQGNENASKNASVQEDSYRTHFQSRLILKSINGLNQSRHHLVISSQTNSEEDLFQAEDNFLGSYSDFKILLSEQYQYKSHHSDKFAANYEKLIVLFNKIFENQSHLDRKIQIKNLSAEVGTLISELYEEESILWAEESMKFFRFAQLKKRNLDIFYALTAFFIFIQIGLIYFTILRYRLNRKIDQQHDQLVLQTRLSTLGMISAELAHEINSPLMVIDGRLKIAQQDLAATEMDKDKLGKNLEVIKRNSARIQSIIKSFKTLSKSGTNDPFEWIQVKHLIEELQELVGQKINEEKIALTFKLPEEDIFVEVRKIQIIQVLTNMVNNSIEAIRDNSEKWIRIEIMKDMSYLHATITDSGNGIAPDQQDHIFEAFYSTKNSNEGTGLGLSISRKIMKEHNGDLTYEPSHPNTQFKLSFRNKKTRDERGSFV
jgi:signal transduction histidine kinase